MKLNELIHVKNRPLLFAMFHLAQVKSQIRFPVGQWCKLHAVNRLHRKAKQSRNCSLPELRGAEFLLSIQNGREVKVSLTIACEKLKEMSAFNNMKNLLRNQMQSVITDRIQKKPPPTFTPQTPAKC